MRAQSKSVPRSAPPGVSESFKLRRIPLLPPGAWDIAVPSYASDAPGARANSTFASTASFFIVAAVAPAQLNPAGASNISRNRYARSRAPKGV